MKMKMMMMMMMVIVMVMLIISSKPQEGRRKTNRADALQSYKLGWEYERQNFYSSSSS